MNSKSFNSKAKRADSIYRRLLFIVGLIGISVSQIVDMPHSALYAFAVVIASIEWVSLVYYSID